MTWVKNPAISQHFVPVHPNAAYRAASVPCEARTTTTQLDSTRSHERCPAPWSSDLRERKTHSRRTPERAASLPHTINGRSGFATFRRSMANNLRSATVARA
jgi:hypothetical protein